MHVLSLYISTSIEDLYKYFGILADAKDQAGKVIIYFYFY